MIQRKVIDTLRRTFCATSRCFLADNLIMAHMRHNANNGLPGGMVSIAKALPQSILIWPILVGEIFVNDGDRLATAAVSTATTKRENGVASLLRAGELPVNIA